MPADFDSLNANFALKSGTNSSSGLRKSLLFARKSSDELFSLVKREAIYERPIPQRHRLVFYLGHLEAFDWNLIGAGQFGLRSLNSEFDQPKHWPDVDDILRYNAAVRKRIDECLKTEISTQLLSAAIEHRLMHAETFAYLLHALPFEHKHGQHLVAGTETRQIENFAILIPAGVATLGAERNENRFAWDNEFDLHQVHVPQFSIQKYKVTNAELAEFVRAGGYQERSLWSVQGWQWIQKAGIKHPGFWISRSGGWTLRTMFAEIPFQPNWPVYVSHAEAEAYARWIGKVLPTEPQFHRAAFGLPEDSAERDFPWGATLPGRMHGTFNCQSWSPVDVDRHPAGESAFGVSGLVGNGWEWTSTLFAPFPGFEPFDFYKGYSAPFFDDQHYVLKGGSPRTSAVFLRRSFRNWFQSYYPNIYAGFRCVEN